MRDAPSPHAAADNSALGRLVQREEVLQICYWMQGEGIGERFDPAMLRPLLQSDASAIAAALEELTAQGKLAKVGQQYRFTDSGRREAGRLFADSFSDFQKQGHGECDAGCCEGEDHSRCGDDCPLH